MIDYFQYIDKCIDHRKFVEKHDPEIHINAATKEVIYPIIKEYGPLLFSLIKEKHTSRIYLKITGSLHKYYNYIKSGRPINYNDFTTDQIKEAVTHLINKLELNYDSPRDQYLVSLEHGYCFNTTYNPGNIIEYNVLHTNERSHSTQHLHNGKGRTKKFLFTNIELKYYDKGKEAKLPENLVRVEITIRNKRECQRHGINSLHDLYDPKVLESLHTTLISNVENTMIVDTHSLPSEATAQEKELFRIFSNVSLLRSQRTGKHKVSRQTISNRKTSLEKILKKYHLQKIKTEWISSIQNAHIRCNQLDENHEIIKTSSDATNLTKTTLYIGGYRQPTCKRVCPITGLDISHQKEDSIYLSEASIRDLYETDRALFNDIRRKYESSIGRERKTVDELCDHLAHQIRDKIRPINRRIKRYADSLFPYDIGPTLIPIRS